MLYRLKTIPLYLLFQDNITKRGIQRNTLYKYKLSVSTSFSHMMFNRGEREERRDTAEFVIGLKHMFLVMFWYVKRRLIQMDFCSVGIFAFLRFLKMD